MTELVSNGIEHISFSTLPEAILTLNNILYRAHQDELVLRQKIVKESGPKAIYGQRPFEISDDINSDPLCHCFKNVRLTIGGKKFNTVEKPIKVQGKTLPYHVFFLHENKVIDPTFGQLLKRQGLNVNKTRKRNEQIFIDGVFVGTISDAKKFNVEH